MAAIVIGADQVTARWLLATAGKSPSGFQLGQTHPDSQLFSLQVAVAIAAIGGTSYFLRWGPAGSRSALFFAAACLGASISGLISDITLGGIPVLVLFGQARDVVLGINLGITVLLAALAVWLLIYLRGGDG